MIYHIILSPDAEADLNSAIWWYQRIEVNLAVRFRAETRAVLRRIALFSYQFPVVTVLKDPVRRALVKHFPYSIYFTLKLDVASVIAVVHHCRNHTVWMDRGNGSY
jgi:plasmid stabilization system protein ParE